MSPFPDILLVRHTKLENQSPERDIVKLTNQQSQILGKGIYTVAEAAKLARVPRARISRWICGYERDGIEYPPLWSPELSRPAMTDLAFVSFADLMEARVIAAFYESGVRIQIVRKAIERAKDLFDVERPFATKRFQTDGKSIFIDIKNDIEKSSEADSLKAYMNIINSQIPFATIIKPAFKDIEFEDNTAARWWPLGKNKTVVVDPSRSLGKPINGPTGVPVEALFDAMDVGDDKKPTENEYSNVAKLFEVSKQDVKDAIDFYEKFAA